MRRMCRVDGPLPLLILAAVFALAGCGGGRGDKGGKGGATTGGTGGATGGMGGGSGGAIGGAGGAIGGSGGSSAGGSGGSSAIGGSGGGGAAGSGGSAGAGGMKGIGTPEICSFTIDGALSTGIPTVGIVNWSTDLAGLSEARIEFTLDDPAADEINRGSGGKIDVAGTTHRALMLGLKPERTYTYRIVATGGGKVCTSADQTLTTGAATGAPAVIRTANDPTAQAPGFIVTCEYPDGCYNPSERPKMAYIIDSDGDVVWWTPSPSLCSKAQMDWEGANMWMIEASGGASDLHTYRIGMDGIGPSTAVPELSRAHHDIAALPGGVVAALVWVQGTSAFYASDLVERAPDGTLKTVVRLDSKIVKPPDNGLFHSNSIKYHPADDTYTVGDIYAAAYVKLTRQGKLLWQFGRNCTGVPAPKCAASDGVGEDHGHHLLANGNILIFNAGSFNPNYLPLVFPAEEYSLTETGDTLTANLVWSYGVPSVYSRILGDVQRLPNGNTLVVFSTTGQIHEVSPSGGLVQTIAGVVSPNNPRSVACFAYADFRETLYGPPPR